MWLLDFLKQKPTDINVKKFFKNTPAAIKVFNSKWENFDVIFYGAVSFSDSHLQNLEKEYYAFTGNPKSVPEVYNALTKEQFEEHMKYLEKEIKFYNEVIEKVKKGAEEKNYNFLYNWEIWDYYDGIWGDEEEDDITEDWYRSCRLIIKFMVERKNWEFVDSFHLMYWAWGYSELLSHYFWITENEIKALEYK